MTSFGFSIKEDKFIFNEGIPFVLEPFKYRTARNNNNQSRSKINATESRMFDPAMRYGKAFLKKERKNEALHEAGLESSKGAIDISQETITPFSKSQLYHMMKKD